MPRSRGVPPGYAAPAPVMLVLGAAVGAYVVHLSWDRSRLHELDRLWAVFATVIVAMLVALSLPQLQRLVPVPGMVPFIIFCTLVATYGCVPETDHIRRVALGVGALVVVEVATWSRLPVLIHGVAASFVLWAGVFGATGRQSALIGALFAWWPVLIVPLVALLWPAVKHAVEPVRWTIAGLGALAAVGVARTGGVEPAGGFALVSISFFGIVSLVLGWLVAVAGSPRVTARLESPLP